MVVDYVVAYLGVIFVLMCYSNLLSNAIYLPVWERQQSIRHLLHINNTSNIAYWTAHIVYELVWALLIVVFTMIIIKVLYVLDTISG